MIRIKAQELRPEYDILNGQFTLLKKYGGIRQESTEAEWAALMDEAERIGGGYGSAAISEYAVAVTLATLDYIERRSRQ